MRSYSLLFLLAFLLVKSSFGQNVEVELSSGISNYFGDLQPSKHYALKYPRAYFATTLKYALNPHFYLRASLSIASVHSEDNPALLARNLNFSSNIQEGNFGIEYRLIDPEKYLITPYVFVCIGGFH